MLPSLLALTTAFFLFASSNALSLDSSGLLARHHQIAARHHVAKRASASARCKKRNSTSTAHATSTAPPASSSSHAPASSSPSGKAGKIGIAWAMGPTTLLPQFITDKVSTIYTWEATIQGKTDGLEFVPMLWSGSSDRIATWKKLVKPGYASVVMAFNEPDVDPKARQANMSPQEAATVWMANGQPLREQGFKTITPAMASSVKWQQDFLALCNTCQWDYMAAHHYSTDPQEMIKYLTNLHNIFGMDIWVTEFACHTFVDGQPQCTEAQVFHFMSTVTAWMDATPYIIKYFAFGVMNNIPVNPLNALINPDGSITALGKQYINS